MASYEGIPSAFAAQPSARSPKLRLYESLFLWNHSVDQLVAVLRGLEKLPFADKRGLQCTQAKSKNFVPASTLISRRRSANVNAATRADSGNNGAPTRRRWKILTTSTLKWKNKRNSGASKDCRRVSASSLIRLWPRNKNASRVNSPARNSSPESTANPQQTPRAHSGRRGMTKKRAQGKAESYVGREHARHSAYTQGEPGDSSAYPQA